MGVKHNRQLLSKQSTSVPFRIFDSNDFHKGNFGVLLLLLLLPTVIHLFATVISSFYNFITTLQSCWTVQSQFFYHHSSIFCAVVLRCCSKLRLQFWAKFEPSLKLWCCRARNLWWNRNSTDHMRVWTTNVLNTK